MNKRAKILLACMTGALVVGTGPMIPSALAADSAMPTKAMPAADPIPFWWFHGELEAGGRVFLNNPEKAGLASQGGKSQSKYYEYNAQKPGPFLNGWLSTGTSDGLYKIDVWAKNVGYADQRYDLDASKAGQHYFNFQWDETPHNRGTGLTLYNGVGSNALTLPAGLSNTLHNDCAVAPGCAVATRNAATARDINNNLQETNIGIRRDTASAQYRWTPTDAWDIKADYSNMHRTGTQVDGVVMSWGTSGVRVDAPKPVDDTTQNYGLNGEYAGTSPWGKKFNFKLAYNGSSYTDSWDSYTIQNPFCATGKTTCDSTSGPLARMSLWPDNHSNGFSATLGADLPAKSRYMGTLSYNMMRQNENFIPFTINPNLGLDPVNGQPWNSTASLPAASLNGAINTLTSNNVVTTQITPDLKSKLSYRYYNFGNDTPEILVPQWIGADINQATPPDLVSPSSASYRNVQSLSISYTKQNAGAELNWRPTHQWNLGAAYGYERYDWTREAADVTNENSGKVFADWKPFTWVTARASWLLSERRYDNYNYLGNIAAVQWQNGGNTRFSSAYREFYLNNRDRNKAQFSVAVDVLRNFTVTPTFGLLNDNFNLNPSTEVGLQSRHAWNGGAELAYLMTADTRFLFAYMYEHRSQVVTSAGANVAPFPATAYYTANVEDKVNTFTAAVDHALIPNKLDVRLGYTASYAVTSQPINFATGVLPAGTINSGGQYPDMKTMFQRLEAIAKYSFDDELVRRLGWKGKVTAKVRYAWERNSVANWQTDSIMPYMGGAPYCTTNLAAYGCGFMQQLAFDNPNYNVHVIAASLSYKW